MRRFASKRISPWRSPCSISGSRLPPKRIWSRRWRSMIPSSTVTMPSYMAMVLEGWALAEQGRPGEGIAQIRQGIAAWRATGAALDRPYFLALLAEVYGRCGEVEEGLAVVGEALAWMHHHGERYWEPELYRL